MALGGLGAKWQFMDQYFTLEILYERRSNEGMIFVTCWSGHTCPSTTHDVILSVHDVLCFVFSVLIFASSDCVAFYPFI
jgi:hypothetical protein